MSDAFCQIYVTQEQSRDAFNFLNGYFCRAGLSIENKYNGNITILADNGKQIVASLKYLIYNVEYGVATSFQWWFTDSVDLYCRFNIRRNSRCFEFSLDGLNSTESDVVINAVIELFNVTAKYGDGIGFIIDKSGITAEYNWDKVFLGNSVITIEHLPDMLMIQENSLSLIEVRHPYSKRIVCDRYILLQKNNL